MHIPSLLGNTAHQDYLVLVLLLQELESFAPLDQVQTTKLIWSPFFYSNSQDTSIFIFETSYHSLLNIHQGMKVLYQCLLVPVKILSSTDSTQISSSFINRHGSNAECEKPPTSSPAQFLSEKCKGSCLKPYRLSFILIRK